MDKRPDKDKVRDGVDWGATYARQAGRAVLWLPVLLGVGIWIYFALPSEPHPAWCALVLVPMALLAAGVPRRAGWGAQALAVALVAIGLGFGAAVAQAHRVAAPVLSGPLAETVEGRVIALSRSQSGVPRVLLDRVRIYGLPADETPARVRIALVDEGAAVPPVGAALRVYARMFPPGGPVEPGAFDFRKRAFFERLGAVGYVRGAAVIDLGPAAARGWGDRLWIWLARQRREIAEALVAALPPAEGAFAAAILVGERSFIEDADQEALRVANLSHLLAISGLHMGILTGLVFAVVRLGLAAVPALALNLPAKKIAAAAALAAGAAYLGLSGATVATQRAFVMVAVALTAVLIDRPALSLRALAVAAAVVMLIRPVSLLGPGFQMSFAATTALIAGYEMLTARRRWPKPSGRARRVARVALVWVGGLVFTSLVAGLATAPYAAAAFNRGAPYGLPANLAAVPVMGLVIAPMAVLAGLAAPFGLSALPLALMGAGIGWVLSVAQTVASWPGAIQPIVAAPAGALALVTLGGLLLALPRGRLRLVGLVPAALGLALWAAAPGRPVALIGPDGRLSGVMGPEGRAISSGRARAFVSGTWLRRDGDLALPEVAAERPGLERRRGGVEADLGQGWRLAVLTGRSVDPAMLAEACGPDTVVVAPQGGPVAGACLYFGERAVQTGGAIAIHAPEAGRPPRIVSAQGRERRLWSLPLPSDAGPPDGEAQAVLSDPGGIVPQ